ncbi:hypothetical protein BJX61DRAFT_338479 [Aspergillus egyptiacus]|nr:hypothetical protein BJX61DRAFT_338479 [Aspergillus egyptiacus]
MLCWVAESIESKYYSATFPSLKSQRPSLCHNLIHKPRSSTVQPSLSPSDSPVHVLATKLLELQVQPSDWPLDLGLGYLPAKIGSSDLAAGATLERRLSLVVMIRDAC